MTERLENIEPLDPKESALEDELRVLAPVSPSAGLKDRIRQAAEEHAPAGEVKEAAPEPNVVQFPGVQSWLAAAAALVAAIFSVALWWQDRNPSESGNLTNAPAVAEEGGSGDVQIWENTPDPQFSGPVLNDTIFVSHENQGVVTSEDGIPMWKIRYELLNRKAWEDPETGAQREEYVPEERILFVPVRHD